MTRHRLAFWRTSFKSRQQQRLCFCWASTMGRSGPVPWTQQDKARRKRTAKPRGATCDSFFLTHRELAGEIPLSLPSTAIACFQVLTDKTLGQLTSYLAFYSQGAVRKVEHRDEGEGRWRRGWTRGSEGVNPRYSEWLWLSFTLL